MKTTTVKDDVTVFATYSQYTQIIITFTRHHTLYSDTLAYFRVLQLQKPYASKYSRLFPFHKLGDTIRVILQIHSHRFVGLDTILELVLHVSRVMLPHKVKSDFIEGGVV